MYMLENGREENPRYLAHIQLGKSLAVEWVGFARSNSVSTGYMATEISDFIPNEIRDSMRDKIPMG
jgi:sorbose reductase